MNATATDDRIDHERELEGQDAEKGKLFEVPRVAIIVDDTDPSVLKLAFSGGIELDRTNASDVELYNRLAAGRKVSLEIEAHVAGAKTSHRRDGEGNVDAVVQTKSLKAATESERARHPPMHEHQIPSDTVQVAKSRLAELERDRTIAAGKRRIIARALSAQGFTVSEIGRLTGVSRSQAWNDLRELRQAAA